jgi:hypothetical protein
MNINNNNHYNKEIEYQSKDYNKDIQDLCIYLINNENLK